MLYIVICSLFEMHFLLAGDTTLQGHLVFSPKIPSEMEVAPRYKLLTLLTLLILLKLFKLFNVARTLACMPIYIVRTLLKWADAMMRDEQNV